MSQHAEELKQLQSQYQLNVEKSMPLTIIKKLQKQINDIANTTYIPRIHKKNVSVHPRNLTVNECYLLEARHRNKILLFISDIRSKSQQNEDAVYADMLTQRDLALALSPLQSSLKFKLPYSTNFHPETEYFDGQLKFQPFTRPISHETRLIVDRHNLSSHKKYNNSKYSASMYHFQTKMRCSIYNITGELPNASSHACLYESGVCFDRCFDCAFTRRVFEKFLIATNNPISVLDYLNKVIFCLNDVCGSRKDKDDSVKAYKSVSDASNETQVFIRMPGHQFEGKVPP
jgi:hypothetical protein